MKEVAGKLSEFIKRFLKQPFDTSIEIGLYIISLTFGVWFVALALRFMISVVNPLLPVL
jgi:hypothetical protein